MTHRCIFKTGFHLTATAAIGLMLATGASAQTVLPRFAGIFSDHAVLQRDEPVKVWGTAAPSHALTLTFNGQSVATTADASGKWQASLAATKAGGPYSLSISDGASATTLNDILVGDVFLCSGQSNMEYALKYATNSWGMSQIPPDNNLRFINIDRTSSAAPLTELAKPAAWQAVTQQTGDVSAVCYHMSKTIAKDQGVPIGMIDSFWGGTTIQSWISDPTLRGQAGYAAGLDAVALMARDPAKAQAEQVKRDEAWWDAHDPSNKANRAFIAPAFNDSKWPTLTADAGWKDKGITELKDFDGVMWLRTTVTLTADQARTANTLQLGPIDTYDTTWVNGTAVGSSGMSWVWRDYPVPAGVFKAGANVIVIRALGGGGLSGQPSYRFVKTSDGQAIPVPATWKYKVGMRAKGLKIAPAPWNIPTSLSTLYNGMIAPLVPYTLKGVAWYQGEANTEAAVEYTDLLGAMMKDWRQNFGKPALPFLIVQLADFGSVATKPGESNWAELRNSQRLAVGKDAHAGLAVTVDIGDRSDIHPTQKTIVGQRLARAAKSVVYGQSVTPGGPEATGVTRSGSDLIIAFKNTNGGLLTYSSDTAIGFEACAGNDCKYATATVSGDTIVLKGANAAGVTQVRYAWADAPYTNLYSADDLPAVPFRMDVAQ